MSLIESTIYFMYFGDVEKCYCVCIIHSILYVWCLVLPHVIITHYSIVRPGGVIDKYRKSHCLI